MTNYEVVDKNGDSWGVYMHRDFAEKIAMRNNEDITLDHLYPFDVEAWEDDE